MSKKFVEKLLKTSATVAVVGATTLGHVVKAEEVAEEILLTSTDTTGNAGEDTELTIPEAEAKVAVAKAEADAAQKAVDAAQAEVTQAQAEVDADVASLDAKTAAVKTAEAELQEAIAIKEEATPEKIAATENDSVVAGLLLTQARQVEQETERAVREQEQVLATTEKTVVATQAEVEELQAEVERLETAVNAPETLETEKTALEQTITSLENQLVAARSELTSLQSSTATEVVSAIEAKKAQIEELERQIQVLENETVTVTNSVSSDVVGTNTIKVSQEFVNQFQTMNYDYVNASQADKNKLIELGKTVLAMNGVSNVWTNSGYQAVAGDNRTVNLNDSVAVANIQTELTLYTAELLNQVRRAFGLNDVTVTNSSLEFAKAVAAAYASNQSYLDYSRNTHRQDLIDQAAAQFGISGGWYENLGSNWVPNNAAASVGDMKKAIQAQLVMMLFQDQTSSFLHTKTFLKHDSSGQTYLGLGLNGMGFDVASASNRTGFSQFYELVNGHEIVTPSLFNKTAIGGTQTVKVDNSAKISALTAQIATLKNDLAQLETYRANPASHPTVVAAQNKITELTNQKSEAESRLQTVLTAIEQANQNKANLQEQLNATQAQLTTAQANLTTATTNRNNASSALAELTEKLTQAMATRQQIDEEVTRLLDLLDKYYDDNLVPNAEKKLAEAKAAEVAAQASLDASAPVLAAKQATLTELEAILATKQAALTEAEAVLAALVAEYEGLLVNRDDEGVHAVLDENLTAEELPVFDPAALGLANSGAGAAGGAAASQQMAQLTNKVLDQAKTTTSATASGSGAATQAKSLPNTGDKSSLVAAAIGAMMLSGAALKGYKRPEEN